MSIIKANTIENVAGTETHSVDTMGILFGTGYIKYPDGTLICYGVISSGTAVDGSDFLDFFGTTSGLMGRFTNSATFGHAFIANTYAITCSSENIYSASVIINTKTTTSFNITEWLGTTRAAGSISWQAIGRWK